MPTETGRIVTNELARKREPRDTFPIITEAVRQIFEASLCDKTKLLRRIALTLHQLTFAVLHQPTLSLAERPQHFHVNTVYPEFLFHTIWLQNYYIDNDFSDILPN